VWRIVYKRGVGVYMGCGKKRVFCLVGGMGVNIFLGGPMSPQKGGSFL